MKHRLLDLLCCPMCHGGLLLDTFFRAAEIEEGALTCGHCGRLFPVINGIPRLLPDALAHVVPAFHPDFFHRHANTMAPYLERCDRSYRRRGWWQAEHRTVISYSYQWRKFRDMFSEWERVFQDAIRPVEPSFFLGKLGLDAGCGFGRSLYYAASYGAEMIGVDLSEAVEAASENTRHLPGVHVIQADLYCLPLKEGTLDFAYSIGVLHHLPDPKHGFFALTKLLKPEAPIFIWVYARGRGRQIPFLTMMRVVSTRLPLRLLDPLCFLAAAVQWCVWVVPYRFLSRFRCTQALVQRLPFTLYANYPFRVLHTDWVDGLSVPLVHYHRREEVIDWLREAGLERIAVDVDWGGRALGRRSAPAVAEVAP